MACHGAAGVGFLDGTSFDRIDEATFRRVVLIFLIVSGASLLV